jgi:hypothetical protein
MTTDRTVPGFDRLGPATAFAGADVRLIGSPGTTPGHADPIPPQDEPSR